MIRRITLPATTLTLSRLSFGTASLHHLYAQKSRQALLNTAFDIGITHFDTSPYYGYGVAEFALGKFLTGKNRADISIATKVGLYSPNPNQHGIGAALLRKAMGKISPDFSKPVVDWAVSTAAQSLDRSLRRLRTDFIDILFLHEPQPELINSEEFLLWLQQQQTAGKIRYWGLAGLALPMKKWLEAKHGLAAVIQTKDSVVQREADVVTGYGRDLQLTYGYLSAGVQQTTEETLRQALQRNRTGSVIFSTRKPERLLDLLHKTF